MLEHNAWLKTIPERHTFLMATSLLPVDSPLHYAHNLMASQFFGDMIPTVIFSLSCLTNLSFPDEKSIAFIEYVVSKCQALFYMLS